MMKKKKKKGGLTLREVSAAADKVNAVARRRLACKRLYEARARHLVVLDIERRARRRLLKKIRMKAFRALCVASSHRLLASRAKSAALGALTATRGFSAATRTRWRESVDAYEKHKEAMASADWMTGYLRERASQPIPAHVRRLMARSHDALDESERLRSRADRGQLGQRCERCNNLGFFQASCPRCRAENPLDNNGQAFVWGTQDANQRIRSNNNDDESSSSKATPLSQESRGTTLRFVNEAACTDDVSALAADLVSKQRPFIPDKPYLPPFKRSYTAYGEVLEMTAALKSEWASFGRRQRPYEAQTLGEATLHMVFHAAAAAVQKFLRTVVPSDFARSILQPPSRSMTTKKDEIFNEDRDYFKKVATKKERKNGQAHLHRGFLRFGDGDVDDTGDIWKRGTAYCFDRSFARGENRMNELRRNFQVDPAAGRRHNHATFKNWLSVTSKQDAHATAGKEATARAKAIETNMKQSQSAWCAAQQDSMRARTNCGEHLTTVIAREFEAEAKREAFIASGLSKAPKQRQREIAKLEEARCEAADRIMRLLVAYGLLRPCDEAAYLQHSEHVAKRCGAQDGQKMSPVRKPTVASVVGVVGVGDTYAKDESSLRSKVEIMSHDDEGHTAKESILDLFYEPAIRGGDFASTSRQLACIKAAGPDRVRRGLFSDNSTIVPATIPVPRALLSGGLSAASKPTKDERRYQAICCDRGALTGSLEKSQLARSVLDEKRAHFIKRGQKTQTMTLPFWTRLTDKAATPGQRLYSEPFGQPMNHFFQLQEKTSSRFLPVLSNAAP